MRPPKIKQLQLGERIVAMLATPGNRAWTASALAEKIGRGVSSRSVAQGCALEFARSDYRDPWKAFHLLAEGILRNPAVPTLPKPEKRFH